MIRDVNLELKLRLCNKRDNRNERESSERGKMLMEKEGNLIAFQLYINILIQKFIYDFCIYSSIRDKIVRFK